MVVAILVLVAAVVGTVAFSFVVVPNALARAGIPPRSARARAAAWATFFAILLVPALVLGVPPSAFGIDLVFLVAIAVAVLYDYYRLNPNRIPWRKSAGTRESL